jgi:hypothetical protein
MAAETPSFPEKVFCRAAGAAGITAHPNYRQCAIPSVAKKPNQAQKLILKRWAQAF